LGNKVYSADLELPAEIDLSQQPKGIYYIRFRAEDMTGFEKIIIN